MPEHIFFSSEELATFVADMNRRTQEAIAKGRGNPNPQLDNAFDECKTVGELLGQLAGSASMCWKVAEQFDLDQANALVDQAITKLRELLGDASIN